MKLFRSSPLSDLALASVLHFFGKPARNRRDQPNPASSPTRETARSHVRFPGLGPGLLKKLAASHAARRRIAW